MMRQRPGLVTLAIGVAAVAAACASAPRSHDYVLGMTCVVVDELGKPVEGAEVVVELGNPVFQAIEPVQQDRRVTPEHGGLVFTYIAHEPTTPYVVKVRKAGYAEAEARGVAASGREGTHLKFVLTRAASGSS
jgi:hypothetical protein